MSAQLAQFSVKVVSDQFQSGDKFIALPCVQGKPIILPLTNTAVNFLFAPENRAMQILGHLKNTTKETLYHERDTVSFGPLLLDWREGDSNVFSIDPNQFLHIASMLNFRLANILVILLDISFGLNERDENFRFFKNDFERLLSFHFASGKFPQVEILRCLSVGDDFVLLDSQYIYNRRK